MTLLQVKGLHKRFKRTSGLRGRQDAPLHAVQDVSFTLGPGETLALVGESGAGKSTTGRLVLRFVEPDAGSVRLDGTDILSLDRRELRRMRPKMQMIFQDPFGSLDPRVPIGESVAEPLLVHQRMPRLERLERARVLLEQCGMGRQHLGRYPADLSGGQLQRAAIARALTLNPKLIVADEPVAALDVSVRAQVLNLMKEVQELYGVAYLFITHDLALVEVIADRVAVMRAGCIIEEGPVRDVFQNPREDYTASLLSAIPVIRPRPRKATALAPPSVPSSGGPVWEEP
jgi:oligopeptide transport system ATP-binding protein